MTDIVRCLFLVPIYAVISTLSYIFYDVSTAIPVFNLRVALIAPQSYADPLILVRDCYEAFVL